MDESWNKVNSVEELQNENRLTGIWVSENTSILVIHGIGNQLPMETLDQFGRGLIAEYKKVFKDRIYLSHEIVAKPSDNSIPWFDNAIRINLKDSDKFIDIYEYYWANYTQDLASYGDIEGWLKGVVKGAADFYEETKRMGVTYQDKSVFTDGRGGFSTWRYRFFLRIGAKLLAPMQFLWALVIKFVGLIPGVGEFATRWLNDFMEKSVKAFRNVIGDIVVYNATDPKSKFYPIRRQISDGAVHAVKYLFEQQTEDKLPYYSKVIIAGHSLGSQVAYDAINKLDFLVNRELVNGYGSDGIHIKTKKNIAEQLAGFITFGSPLDKIAFFLREKVKDKMYLRQQILDNYHGFKQRNWSLNTKHENGFTSLPQPIHRLFEEIQWRNYFDDKDYVSGALDYYKNLQNVNCKFKAGPLGFTHSNYWEHELFYKDIIRHFLS
ncbi:MAG: hypothetical protein MUF75_03310 [Bacteroidia bacterium]|jgi:hypothetical protein|nr:hypothetical protein [Bacteroidia bacterium]